jgi:hypothetical protein
MRSDWRMRGGILRINCPAAARPAAAAGAGTALSWRAPRLRDRLSWEKAVDEIGDKLLEIREKSGPAPVYWLGSAKFTNEAAYLYRKLVAFWGTNKLFEFFRSTASVMTLRSISFRGRSDAIFSSC